MRGQRGNSRVKVRQHTEESIQKALWLRKPILTNPQYEMFNLMLYAWESDYLAISKGGRVYEVEIKVSHADFLNEAKNKEKKMQLLGGTIVTEEEFYGYITPGYDRQMPKPNYFYYVCPQGVIAPEEVPEFAGLLYITDDDGFRMEKVARELHRQKHSFAVESLRDKFYWGMWNWIRRYWRNVGKAKNIAPQTAAAYEKALNNYAEDITTLKEKISDLTRWRDPKQELPDDFRPVEVKYSRAGHIGYAVAYLRDHDDFDVKIWMIDCTKHIIDPYNVIGWRQIV